METPGLKKSTQLAMYAINEAEDAIKTALLLAQKEKDQLELQKEQRRNMPKSSFSQWPGDIFDLAQVQERRSQSLCTCFQSPRTSIHRC